MSKSRLIEYAMVWLGVALLAGTARAVDWTNPYIDEFDANLAESDSYAHSLFWFQDVTPLPQPYLYYLETDNGRGLAFVDFEGQPAELSYAFTLPSWQTQKTVVGIIEVDVSFPSNTYISQFWSGELSYQTSSNGMTWSNGTPLSAGYNYINVACPEGTCYVRFSGTRAVIDRLSVSQYNPPATIRVPLYHPTIQAAIDNARNGDVIEVAPGTYSGPGNRDIDFRGRAITIRSASGPQATIIDCTGGRRGFYFHTGENADAILAGFTIQGGRVGAEVPPSLPPLTTGPALSIGGGIYCESASPTIANCIITNCTAGIGGGIGIAQAQPVIVGCTITNCTAVRGAGIGVLAQSNATITDCVVENNKGTGAGLGGGIYCLDSGATVSGCRIANNTAGNTIGGGAYCSGWSTNVLFQNSLIVGNSANSGSGLYAEQSTVSVLNCTIAQNRLTASGTGGGVRSNSASIFVSNSIIWGNGGTPLFPDSGLPVSYSDIEGGYIGMGGNISQDPRFVSTTDFHLQSARGHYKSQSGLWVNDPCTSPCIDAGDPSVSATGEPAPNGDRINMGAYGGSPQASKGAQHTIYHVAVDSGSDFYNGLSLSQPFRTIGKAVTVAHNGDAILVWPGTYTLSRKDEVNFNGKAITIQSAADAAVISAPDGYAFSFYTSEGSGSILSNFVIRGCGTGAIFCYGASPTLKNLTIVGNRCGVYAINNANPYIVNCIFWANSEADLSQDRTGFCSPYYSLVNKKIGKTVVNDPLFADPANGDYHLKSESGRYVPSLGAWVTDTVTSPCIDAGDPTEYPRAEPMPHGNRIDMGAYGGTPYASRSKNGPPY